MFKPQYPAVPVHYPTTVQPPALTSPAVSAPACSCQHTGAPAPTHYAPTPVQRPAAPVGLYLVGGLVVIGGAVALAVAVTALFLAIAVTAVSVAVCAVVLRSLLNTPPRQNRR